LGNWAVRKILNMGLVRKIISKLFFKQWTIGVAEINIKELLERKQEQIDFCWYNTGNLMQSFADPFVLNNEAENNLTILAEEFTTGQHNGKISKVNFSKSQGFSKPTSVLKTKSHLSYPVVFEENKKVYLLPENAYSGGLFIYEYDKDSNELTNKRKLSNLPLVDATLLRHNGKYWLFASLLGKNVMNQLHIFFADNILGPYFPHFKNPVKNHINGSRCAGSFFRIGNELFRPSQNCEHYYGESITIQKITRLNTEEFEEEQQLVLNPKMGSEFSFGIHTLNISGNYIIADGQKGHFQPVRQTLRAIYRLFNPRSNKSRFTSYYYDKSLVESLNNEGLALMV
jgi:hypothetical protein